MLKIKEDSFISEYNGASIEDDIICNSEEMKSFARKFRAYLKRVLPECSITGFSLGHYDVSAFVKKNGRCVYLSYSVPRYGQEINAHERQYMNNAVLYRFTKDDHDYTGATNYFCTLADIGRAVNDLFDGPRYEFDARYLH